MIRAVVSCSCRLGRNCAGQRAHHDAAGFGLPPGIDNRTTLAADLAVVPHPGLGIDPFADAAKQAETAEVAFVDPLVAPLDKGTNRGRRGVEDRDFVLFDEFPEAAFVGRIGSAFVHQARCTSTQWTIDQIAMSRDPAGIGRAPIDIFVAMIKDPFKRLLAKRL